MGTKRQEIFRIGMLLGKSYTTIGTSSHGSVSLFWWQVSSVLDPILTCMIDWLAQSDCIHLKFQDHQSYQLTFNNLGDGIHFLVWIRYCWWGLRRWKLAKEDSSKSLCWNWSCFLHPVCYHHSKHAIDMLTLNPKPLQFRGYIERLGLHLEERFRVKTLKP